MGLWLERELEVPSVEVREIEGIGKVVLLKTRCDGPTICYVPIEPTDINVVLGLAIDAYEVRGCKKELEEKIEKLESLATFNELLPLR